MSAESAYVEGIQSELGRYRAKTADALKSLRLQSDSLPRAAREEQQSLRSKWDAEDKLTIERTSIKLKDPSEYVPLSSLPTGLVVVVLFFLFIFVLVKIKPSIDEWWPAMFLSGLIAIGIGKTTEWLLQMIYGMSKYKPHADRMQREREELQRKTRARFEPQISAVDNKLRTWLQNREAAEREAKTDAEVAERWHEAFEKALQGLLTEPVPAKPIPR